MKIHQEKLTNVHSNIRNKMRCCQFSFFFMYKGHISAINGHIIAERLGGKATTIQCYSKGQ